MIAVDNQTNDENDAFDGILGLSPIGFDGAQSVVNTLSEQGVIPAATFGVAYTNNSEQSWMTFGGVNTTVVTNSS